MKNVSNKTTIAYQTEINLNWPVEISHKRTVLSQEVVASKDWFFENSQWETTFVWSLIKKLY